jgi:murein DD-endopeptidase MepM/ murein hydrolase activator NlpD
VASRFVYLLVFAVWIAALWLGLDYAEKSKSADVAIPTINRDWSDFFAEYIFPNLPVANEFDTPLRPPDGLGAFISLPFMEEGHLGEDWTTAKGDSALGEPVYSIGDGWVSLAHDFEGEWGKVVLISYRLPDGRYPPFVEVMYAMLDTMKVVSGQFVKRGQQVGTVGNANGTYKAHLHWEVRYVAGKGLGPGFDSRNDGWLEPMAFLKAHRGDRSKVPLLPKVLSKSERAGWGSED